MRLNDFNPANIRVRDQRGGGGGGGLPGGGIGIVGVLVVLAVAYFTGADPAQLLGGLFVL